MTERRGVVLLDKDGTLVEDLPYNVDPDRIRLAPGAARAIGRFGAAGLDLVVATNQSGVARGYFTERDLERVEAHLRGVVAAAGARLAGFYACPHLPDGLPPYDVACECRKPEPGLLLRACRDLGVDPAECWFIGDTWMDVAAGRAAGCRTILVGPEHRTAPHLPVDRRPDHAVRDLAIAAELVIAALDADLAEEATA